MYLVYHRLCTFITILCATSHNKRWTDES